jgi:hypothetical protein
MLWDAWHRLLSEQRISANGMAALDGVVPIQGETKLEIQPTQLSHTTDNPSHTTSEHPLRRVPRVSQDLHSLGIQSKQIQQQPNHKAIRKKQPLRRPIFDFHNLTSDEETDVERNLQSRKEKIDRSTRQDVQREGKQPEGQVGGYVSFLVYCDASTCATSMLTISLQLKSSPLIW